ncbi:hypothetical protein JX265_012633 [Neoarthrinium moseri]|uniref:Uncharacterized protein n=1 Tax=Neoarthrinium moseri TaxID=1658444 RepID=A0A9Q0AIB9_9PEZI|nr:hypothetical protein JX266_011309 [Neoarthrinium moseri]KAI1853802.1 hypothetical protein JX265_012633 [Neoarthrinium moseri]
MGHVDRDSRVFKSRWLDGEHAEASDLTQAEGPQITVPCLLRIAGFIRIGIDHKRVDECEAAEGLLH